MSRTLTKTELERILSAAEYKKIKIRDIKPAPYNPRVDLQPGDEDYERIKDSIYNHTIMQPIVFNKRTSHAVGGNQRLKIYTEEGVEETTCAVIDVDLNREKQINLALNKITNMWDQPKLREILMGLKGSGYDLNKTGFKQYDIGKLTQSYGMDLGSFFDDDEEESKHEKKVHTYKCPYCGEVFTK